ncbi:MAG TPA: response regulator [Blastocatellia bacterium]|nr:response regulator [Blastocatellia bacterium]
MATELPSVLLVEDHEDTRKMLELLFEEWGYRATIVATATDGLKQLLERSFDLIVLDNWLPDLDGIELCRQIRAIGRQTPIIFYSAASMGSEDHEATACGANAYVYKGNGLGSLRQTMAEELEKARSKPQKKAPQN